MHKAVIMAGGTGGHIFPGLAVAEELQRRDWQVEWIGTADRMEAELVPKYKIPIHFIDVKGVRGKGPLTKLYALYALLRSIGSARKILKNIQPDVVLGMGGYASGPGGVAAYLLGIPLVIHEQNAVFGLTNRLLAKIANIIVTGFDCASNRRISRAPKNSIWVGNPVRQAFFTSTSAQYESQTAVNILITGGSLGALALNQQLPPIINRFAGSYSLNVLHQCGKDKSNSVSAYAPQVSAEITEFIDDTAHAFAWADIIICRAGALTVSEVAAAGKAAIFVPLPIAVDDHQRLNAAALVEQDAAYMVIQTDIEHSMPSTLLKLLEPEERSRTALNARQFARQDAAAMVAKYCIQLVKSEANYER